MRWRGKGGGVRVWRLIPFAKNGPGRGREGEESGGGGDQLHDPDHGAGTWYRYPGTVHHYCMTVCMHGIVHDNSVVL